MVLEHLALINFRNYAYERIDFSPGCNVFYGKNAQGKTNLLESIYITARGHSFKSVTDRELIRFGERSGYIQSDLRVGMRSKKVEFKFSRVDRKRVRINEVEVDRIKDLSAQFDVILFAPEHLELVQGGPSVRRKFMDDLLEAIEPQAASTLRDFSRLLTQRNTLIRRKPPQWKEQLEIYDRQFSDLSLKIRRWRESLVSRLIAQAKIAHERISNGKEKLQIGYETNLKPDSDEILKQLRESREEDMVSGRTKIGPHVDDLEILLNDYPAKNFASQGQSRSITLSCKMAELSIREKEQKHQPLLLLDDVFSELDERRSADLLKSIGAYQSIVTTNHADFLKKMAPQSAFFEVREGRVYRQST